MDIVYHYPPELMALLVDVIPKLCRSKQNLIDFFKGAGVDRGIIAPIQTRIDADRDAINKYEMTRSVLAKLNDFGETTLRERREILKRVLEFDDFSVCWENDRREAQGLVAQIGKLVDLKDSVTKITLDLDAERSRRIAGQEARVAEKRERSRRIDVLKKDLFALFSQTDPHKRGKALEGVLDALFREYGLLVREPFTINGGRGEGVIEQVDGLIEMDGILYLVEMKWWKGPIGPGETAQHLVRVFNRGGQARGLFISHTDFTSGAIASCKEALSAGAVVVLCRLEEIVALLEREGELKDLLKAKVTAAIADKEPLFIPPR